MNAEQKKASFVKRARVSANAGPYLFLAGVVLAITGYALGALHIGIMAAMGVAAVILQAPRQKPGAHKVTPWNLLLWQQCQFC